MAFEKVLSSNGEFEGVRCQSTGILVTAFWLLLTGCRVYGNCTPATYERYTAHITDSVPEGRINFEKSCVVLAKLYIKKYDEPTRQWSLKTREEWEAEVHIALNELGAK